MNEATIALDPILTLGLSLLFWLLTLGLLALPFYPAWREWRHPSDDAPLAWPSAAQSTSIPAAAALHATATDMPSVGAKFEAPHPSDWHRRHRPHSPQAFAPPNAQPWGPQGWRVQGDCELPKGSYLPGSLVVTGQLRCGPDSVVEGDVKAHGQIRLDPGSLLMGALIGHGDISVGPDAEVLGPVLAQGAVRLAAGARIGRSDRPTSLSAQRLLAHRHAVVHGQVFTPDSRGGS